MLSILPNVVSAISFRDFPRNAAADARIGHSLESGKARDMASSDTTATAGATSTTVRDRPYADVLIIGGGINGIATFRDLALQGVDVALVERGDYISGASAASSHMIHGGIRYLENGEFRLVHEAVTERNALLKTAPHFVRPLQTTIPIYSTFSGILSAPLRFLRHGAGGPTERGAALIKIGLVIYDSFSRGGGRVQRHEFHGRQRSLEQVPALNPRVKYTATYWDASLRDPERLAGDVLRDGLRDGRVAGDDRSADRARAANYTAAVGADDGRVLLRDDAGEYLFTASVIVNASGPWTDLTNVALGDPTQYMGGTKGSHIVLDHPELLAATGGRELFFEHSDGRIVLIYPLKGRVIVGTTDLEHDMRESAVCTEEEVDYFFDLIGHVFPTIPVDRSQIVFRFSGVRPLPGHGGTAPGFVSRDYRIEAQQLPGAVAATVLSLVGGKWTTFRASAAHLTDRVLAELARPRTRSTRGLPIGGGAGYPTSERARRQWLAPYAELVGLDRAATLLERYGTVAAEVIDAIVAAPDDAPLITLPEYSTAELQHLARAEQVVHLADLLLRRSSIAFSGHARPDAVAEVAQTIAGVLGWDAATVATETDRALAEVHAADPSARTTVA